MTKEQSLTDLAAEIRADHRRELAQLITPGDPLASSFLRSVLYCLATKDGHPAPALLGELGVWICAFTDQVLLDTYRAATGAPWLTSARYVGNELTRLAVTQPVPTGVLINPSPCRGVGAGQSLPLPPETLARLRDGASPADVTGSCSLR